MLLVHQVAARGFFFGFVRKDVGPVRVGEADLQTLLTGPSEEAEDLSVGSWGVDSGLNVQLALQGGLEQKWRKLAAADGWEEVATAPELRLSRFWRKISLSMDPRRDAAPEHSLEPPSKIISHLSTPGPYGKKMEAWELTLLSRVYSNPSLRRGCFFWRSCVFVAEWLTLIGQILIPAVQTQHFLISIQNG